MARTLKVAGLVVLLAVALLAGAAVGGGRAAGTTTETTTGGLLPAPTTVFETTTIAQTTTQRLIVQPPETTTTDSESGESGAPAWAWLVIVILGVGLIALIALFIQHRGDGVASDERRRRLDGAAASWVAQGWALDSQTAESAVLRHGNQLMLISIDEAGHLSTRPLASDV